MKRLLLTLVLAVLSVPAVWSAEVTIEPIVITGDPVPGFPEGTVFDQFIFGDTSLIDQGETLLFKALVEGPQTTPENRETLWFFDRSQLTLVARSGEALPEISSHAVVESILVDSNNSARSSGRFGVFRATISDQSAGSRLGDAAGAWAVVDGHKVLLAKSGDPAPGLSQGATFRRVWAYPGERSEFVLFAITSPSAARVGVELRSGLWSVSLAEGPTVEPIALPGQSIAGTALRTLDQLFWFQWIDLVPPYSLMVHSVAIGPGVDDFSDEVLLSVKADGLSVLLREGEPIANGNKVFSYGGQAGHTSMWNLMTSPYGDALFHAQIEPELGAVALVVLRQGTPSILARFDEPAPGVETEWWGQDGGEFLSDGSLVVVGRVDGDRLAIWREREFGLIPTFVGMTGLVGPYSEFVPVRQPRFRHTLTNGRVIAGSLVRSDSSPEARGLLTIGLEGDATALVVIGQELRSSSGAYLPAGAAVPPVVNRFELLGADDDGRVSLAIEFNDGSQGIFAIDVDSDAVFVDAFETGTLSRWTTVGAVEN